MSQAPHAAGGRRAPQSTRKILIASADKQLRVSISLLWDSPEFETYTVKSSEEALAVLKDFRFDQVIVDSNLPSIGGRKLKLMIERSCPGVPVLLLDSFSSIRSSEDLLRFGTTDFIVDKEELSPLLRASLLLGSAQDSVAKLKKCYLDTLTMMVGLIEMHDTYRSGDCHYVARYVSKIAKKMELPEDAVEALQVAAMFRDIWKYVLLRPLPETGLSPSEQASLRKHTQLTVRILEDIEFPWDVKSILYHHHERYDGTGYPDGIKGRAIPIGSRILAVVDAYQTMVSQRSFRAAINKDDAVRELVSNAGSQFDPEITEVFCELLNSEEEAVWYSRKKRETVLVLDANGGDLSLLKVKLNAEGYKVIGTSEADEGLRLIEEARPSVIICSTELVGMDGFTFYNRASRLATSTDAVPFIFMSDRNARVDRREALLMGAEDFLYKPVLVRDLLLRLEVILKRRREEPTGMPKPIETGLTGTLQDLSIPEIIQILEMGRKTAVITIRGAEKHSIYMVEGQVRHAEANGKTGEAAFLEILRIRDARFSITHGVTVGDRTITRTNLDLLLDSMRLLDEEKRDTSGPHPTDEVDGALAEETDAEGSDPAQHEGAEAAAVAPRVPSPPAYGGALRSPPSPPARGSGPVAAGRPGGGVRVSRPPAPIPSPPQRAATRPPVPEPVSSHRPIPSPPLASFPPQPLAAHQPPAVQPPPQPLAPQPIPSFGLNAGLPPRTSVPAASFSTPSASSGARSSSSSGTAWPPLNAANAPSSSSSGRTTTTTSPSWASVVAQAQAAAAASEPVQAPSEAPPPMWPTFPGMSGVEGGGSETLEDPLAGIDGEGDVASSIAAQFDGFEGALEGALSALDPAESSDPLATLEALKKTMNASAASHPQPPPAPPVSTPAPAEAAKDSTPPPDFANGKNRGVAAGPTTGSFAEIDVVIDEEVLLTEEEIRLLSSLRGQGDVPATGTAEETHYWDPSRTNGNRRS